MNPILYTIFNAYMKALFCFILTFIVFSSFGQSTNYSTKYDVSIKWNDAMKTMSGDETIHFKNVYRDTLNAIWIRLDANAYSSDTTRYSEYLIGANQTKFYFSSKEDKGYIDSLDFHILSDNNEIDSIEHFSNELIKIHLSKSLKRDENIIIGTHFYLQTPRNFNNNGYSENFIQLQNWIPQIAGIFEGNWNIESYTHRGSIYQNESNYNFKFEGLDHYSFLSNDILALKNLDNSIHSSSSNFTLFKNVNLDTIQIVNGARTIKVNILQPLNLKSRLSIKNLQDSVQNIISLCNRRFGELPSNSISIFYGFDEIQSFDNNSEVIVLPKNIKDIEQGIMSSIVSIYVSKKIEMDYQMDPRLSLGLSQYLYENVKNRNSKNDFFGKKMPDCKTDLSLFYLYGTKRLQPFNLPTNNYNSVNYPLSPKYSYSKNLGQNNIGLLDSISIVFKSDDILHKDQFPSRLIYDSIYTNNEKQETKFTFLYNLSHTDKYKYISIGPAIGFNNYDKFMLGVYFHNYQIPQQKFSYFLSPLYSFSSQKLNGVGHLEYNIWDESSNWKFGLGATKYTIRELDLPQYDHLYQNMYRIAPSIRYTKYINETRSWNLLARDLIIHHQDYRFDYNENTQQYSAYNQNFKTNIVELKLGIKDDRNLYPYSADLDLIQVKNVLRLSWTGKYFFNYNSNGDGISTRFFVGKLFYLKPKTNEVVNANSAYGFNLNGANGAQDFMYSDYFIGRNERTGWISQQIMERDGFFKVWPKGFSGSLFYSDNWLSAMNIVADIPSNINPFKSLPFKMPLKLFLDLGTYSDLWSENANAGKILYDAGVQISVLRSLVNIYVPILYSKKIRDTNSSYNFLNSISFSINLDVLNSKLLFNK